MASDRIRGQETSLQVTIDGELQTGSFAKVEGFDWNPLDDLPASQFIGESEADFDTQHDGYEMKFTIHEKDNSAVENVLLQYVNALQNGTTMPKIVLTFIKRYRDPAIPARTLVFQSVALKMDSQSAGDRKGYVKSTFSGKCRRMKVV